jgi:hypothetical protein
VYSVVRYPAQRGRCISSTKAAPDCLLHVKNAQNARNWGFGVEPKVPSLCDFKIFKDYDLRPLRYKGLSR